MNQSGTTYHWKVTSFMVQDNRTNIILFYCKFHGGKGRKEKLNKWQ